MGREIVSVGEEVEDMARWSSSTTSTNSKLPLLSLNHVSFICKSVTKSVRFYEDVLGFVLIKRPSSFDFEGAWLFSHGVGIHLLESDKVPAKKVMINPKDNHISFQCSDMELIMRKLEDKNIEYVTAVVEEGGITVDQLFFHDPDGYMVEICNCHVLPVLPLSSCPLKKLPNANGNHTSSSFYGTFFATPLMVETKPVWPKAKLRETLLRRSGGFNDGELGGGYDGYFILRDLMRIEFRTTV